MANPGTIPPYPEPANPAKGESYPVTGVPPPGITAGKYVYYPQGGQAYPATGVPPPGTTAANYVQYPYGGQPGGPIYVMPPGVTDPSIAQIRDWLPWSITNLFVGWLLIGIIPLIFSIICRSRKRANNASGARTMGTFALISNILVSLVGLAAWIGLIVGVVLAAKATSSVVSSYNNNVYGYGYG